MDDPRFFGHGLEEEAADVLNGFHQALAGKLGYPFQLALALECAGCIGGNGGVVGTKSNSKAVKQVSPLALVVAVIAKKDRKAIISSRDINGLKEVGKNLMNFPEVVMGWGACDGGGLDRGVAKEIFFFLRHSHCSLGRRVAVVVGTSRKNNSI